MGPYFCLFGMIVVVMWTRIHSQFCDSGTGVCNCQSYLQCSGVTINCHSGMDCRIDCGNGGCQSATINCADNSDCDIYCNDYLCATTAIINGNNANNLNIYVDYDSGDRALQQTVINCPTKSTATCHVDCGDFTTNCYLTDIIGTNSGTVEVICGTSPASQTCRQLDVWCPDNGGMCKFTGNPNTEQMSLMNIYADDGFNQVYVYGNPSGTSIGSLHCSAGVQCTIDGANPNQCSSASDCDRTPTDAPTTSVPTTDFPTKIPTEPPTKIPTEPPTKIPTQPPTKMPTESPTKLPTETETPTILPTESPLTGSPTQPVSTGTVCGMVIVFHFDYTQFNRTNNTYIISILNDITTSIINDGINNNTLNDYGCILSEFDIHTKESQANSGTALINISLSSCDQEDCNKLYAYYNDHLEDNFIDKIDDQQNTILIANTNMTIHGNNIGVAISTTVIQSTEDSTQSVDSFEAASANAENDVDIIIGCIVALVFVAVIIVFIWYKRKANKANEIDIDITDVNTSGTKALTTINSNSDITDLNTAGIAIELNSSISDVNITENMVLNQVNSISGNSTIILNSSNSDHYVNTEGNTKNNNIINEINDAIDDINNDVNDVTNDIDDIDNETDDDIEDIFNPGTPTSGAIIPGTPTSAIAKTSGGNV